MRVQQRLNNTTFDYAQQYGRKDGIIIRRRGKVLDVAFYQDLAPTVPYKVDSVHTIEGGRVRPPAPKPKLRALVKFINLITRPKK